MQVNPPSFLIKILGLALAMALLAGCAPQSSSPDQTVWHLSTWGNPRAVTKAITHVADTVERRSGGSFIIKVHFGEAVSPARQNLESLSIGLVDAAQTCSSYHPGKTPAMTALELPYLPINGLEETIAVHSAFYAHPVVQAELARWQAQFLFLVPTPQPEFMGRGKAPLNVADWKGKRVRATGGLAEAMVELGAAPVGAPPPEVYLGLERNLFQAAAFPYTYAFGAYRLFEVSDWYTTNMRAAGFNCPVLVSAKSYAALSDSHQTLLQEAIEDAYAIQLAGFVEADKTWLQAFERRGLEPITYSQETLMKLRDEAATPVWEAWTKRLKRAGLDGDALLTFVLKQADAARKTGATSS